MKLKHKIITEYEHGYYNGLVTGILAATFFIAFLIWLASK